MEKKMTLRWLGHSCFLLKAADWTVAIDPYRDGSVPGYPPLRIQADQVLCSHGHDDHDGVETVTVSGRTGSPLSITEISCPHDDAGGAKRGMNIIRVFEYQGLRAAHFGDMGCMLSAKQLEILEGLDAAMLPVGGFYTIDGAQAAELVRILRPRTAIPMHYRCGERDYDVLGTANSFMERCENAERADTDTIEITGAMPRRIVMLEYKGQRP